MSILIVIPARHASVRLPGKPLLKIGDKPMIQWVYEAARRSTLATRVVVATDDDRIASAVAAFGGEAVMTDPELPSGTDRVAAVADQIPAEIYVNLQGDEPLMAAETIDRAIEVVQSGDFEIGTAMTPLDTDGELQDLNTVKVICDARGQAIYFSRYPIPYSRQKAPPAGEKYLCRRHLGIYVFKRDALRRFTSLPPTVLERAESLEQLRALYHGIPIGVAEVSQKAIGVDTPDDLERVRRLLV